jgi:hypothetical protein
MAKIQFQWDGKTYECDTFSGERHVQLPDGTILILSPNSRALASVVPIPAAEVVKHRFIVEFTGVPFDRASDMLVVLSNWADNAGGKATSTREAK